MQRAHRTPIHATFFTLLVAFAGCSERGVIDDQPDAGADRSDSGASVDSGEDDVRSATDSAANIDSGDGGASAMDSGSARDGGDAGSAPIDGGGSPDGGAWPPLDGGFAGCPAMYATLVTGLSEGASPIGPGPAGELFYVDPITDADGFRTWGVTAVTPGQPPRRVFDSTAITQVRRNAAHFYLVAQAGTTRSLYRVPLSGGTPTRVPGTTPMQAVSSVFALDSAVYWTRTDASAPVTTDLMRTDPSTLTNTVVRRLPDFSVLVHANDTHVYYSTRLEVGRMRLSDNTLETVFAYPELRIPESLVFEGSDLYLLEDSILPTVRALKFNLAATPPTSATLFSETPAMSGRTPYRLDVGQSTLTVAFLQGGRSSYASAPKAGGALTLIPGAADTGLSVGLLRLNRCQTFWQTRGRNAEVSWRLDPP